MPTWQPTKLTPGYLALGRMAIPKKVWRLYTTTWPVSTCVASGLQTTPEWCKLEYKLCYTCTQLLCTCNLQYDQRSLPEYHQWQMPWMEHAITLPQRLFPQSHGALKCLFAQRPNIRIAPWLQETDSEASTWHVPICKMKRLTHTSKTSQPWKPICRPSRHIWSERLEHGALGRRPIGVSWTKTDCDNSSNMHELQYGGIHLRSWSMPV